MAKVKPIGKVAKTKTNEIISLLPKISGLEEVLLKGCKIHS